MVKHFERIKDFFPGLFRRVFLIYLCVGRGWWSWRGERDDEMNSRQVCFKKRRLSLRNYLIKFLFSSSAHARAL